jgi:CRISPR-associated Csx2 family protein
MSETIFLSFLGTNKYLECIYQFPESESVQTKYTQIAVIQKHISDIKEFIFFLTEDAKKQNWEDDTRLKSELKKLNIDESKIKTIDIPNGFNNNELLEIFTKLVNNIPDNANLIIDVTHSFRSLPITLSSVLNYLKKVKNVQIVHIYYGAFEVLGDRSDVKNTPIVNRIAPMLDITYLSAIQDWTTAIDHFLKFGNISKLKQLSKSTLNPILAETRGQDQLASKIKYIVNTLEDLLTSIYTCRSNTLLEIFSKNNNESKLDTLLKNLDFITNNNSLIPQLNEPFKKIKEKITLINDDNPIIGSIKVVQWCIDFNWIQQGFTLLQENLISIIIQKFNRDYTKKDERENLSKALNIIANDTPEKQWETNKKEFIMFYVNQKEKLIDIARLYTELSDFRNDINHAGYRDNARGSGVLVKKLSFYYKEILKEIENLKKYSIILINLSNHPFDKWSEKQKQTALSIYQSIYDIDFPKIDPNGDEAYINNLANEYLFKILEIKNKYTDKLITIHLMGELTFCFALLKKLQDNGIPCVASTTERIVVEEDNKKTSTFNFVKFRKYS